jgi:branched-subunit amino acid transport protein
MTHDGSLWLIFILLGLATLLPRASFIVLAERLRLPPVLERALRYAPVAALAAILAPDLTVTASQFDLFNARLIAGTTAALAVLLSRNPWLPFIAGMAVLLSMQNLIGA